MNAGDAERLFEAKQAYDKAKDTYEMRRDKAVEELRGCRKGKEEQETVKVVVGRVVVSVSYNDAMLYVAWEKIVERVQELFPTVAKVMGNIMRGSYTNADGDVVPYVKPSPRATLKLSVKE